VLGNGEKRAVDWVPEDQTDLLVRVRNNVDDADAFAAQQHCFEGSSGAGREVDLECVLHDDIHKFIESDNLPLDDHLVVLIEVDSDALLLLQVPEQEMQRRLQELSLVRRSMHAEFRAGVIVAATYVMNMPGVLIAAIS
jgi:hypothetical protein